MWIALTTALLLLCAANAGICADSGSPWFASCYAFIAGTQFIVLILRIVSAH